MAGDLNRYIPEWSVTHAPAVNTQASASRPAVPTSQPADNRHVCTSISATLTAGSTPTANTATLVLRDGASGAGTILWSQTMGIHATFGEQHSINFAGLNIIGSPNTAMTLEFTGAVATIFESVAMTGYTI